MSKSVGNVIDPVAIVDEYGADALRYFLARHIHPFEDSDFTMEKFKETYNADLANGLGNLVARVMTMATKHLSNPVELTGETQPDPDVSIQVEKFELNHALDRTWERIGHDDALIAIKKPFALIASDNKSIRDEALLIIKKLVRELNAIATELEPFMPTVAKKIKEAVATHRKPENLFPRKE
jgi:methionyl-tRNA synthetase